MTARTYGELAINEARALRLVLASWREIEDGDNEAAFASRMTVFAEADHEDLQDIACALAEWIVQKDPLDWKDRRFGKKFKKKIQDL